MKQRRAAIPKPPGARCAPPAAAAILQSMPGLQARELTPVLDRIATARSPKAYRDAEGELFALEVEDRADLIRELGEPHCAESALALEELLLTKVRPDVFEKHALDGQQPSAIRAAMAGLLGRVALNHPNLRSEIRRHLELLGADPVPRVSATAKYALSDLGG